MKKQDSSMTKGMETPINKSSTIPKEVLAIALGSVLVTSLLMYKKKKQIESQKV